MMPGGNKPHVRDFFQEAIDISNGKSIKVKREHVQALASAYLGLFYETKHLKSVMKRAFDEAVRVRAERGDPVPPMPKDFKGV